MKTNEEARELIYKKAKEHYRRKRLQQKKIVLNSLTALVVLPAIMLSFSLNKEFPTKDNPAEDSEMSSQTQSFYESSAIPQRRVIYAEENYLKNIKNDSYIGSSFRLYKEEFFKKYEGQDVEFLVSIKLGELNDEMKEVFNNTPLKSAELYPDITWNEFKKIQHNFVYHYYNDEYTGEYTYDSLGNKITYGDFTYDLYGNRVYKDENVIAEIDRMFKYENSLKAELSAMIEEYQYKALSELNIKFADDLNEKYELYYPLAYITFDDIEKLKALPFGMMLVAVPEDVEQLKFMCTDE